MRNFGSINWIPPTECSPGNSCFAHDSPSRRKVFMKRLRLSLLIFCFALLACTVAYAARLTLFIDGEKRTAYDDSRGKAGRAEWAAAVGARKGVILTNDFQGVNIDVPAEKVSSVGHFSVFFSQTGGYSAQ